MGINESTVRTHYANAMAKIHLRLTEDEEFATMLSDLQAAARYGEPQLPNETLEEVFLRIDMENSILGDWPDEPCLADVEDQLKWAKENLSEDEYIKFFTDSNS